MGEIGVHFPREIVRIERDYSGGELVQYVHLMQLWFWTSCTHGDPFRLQGCILRILWSSKAE